MAKFNIKISFDDRTDLKLPNLELDFDTPEELAKAILDSDHLTYNREDGTHCYILMDHVNYFEVKKEETT